MADVMADLVAAMLGGADLGRPGLGLVVRSQHRLEKAGSAEDVGHVIDEQVEEPHVARDEAKTHWSLRLARSDRRSRRSGAGAGDWVSAPIVAGP